MSWPRHIGVDSPSETGLGSKGERIFGGPVSAAEVDLEFENDLGVALSGIPNSYTINIPSIPKISVGLDPVTIQPLTILPLDLTVRIREFPSIRAHLPANFTLGFGLLGYEILCVRLCGEAQIITEPYDPNPCEDCEDERRPDRPPRNKPPVDERPVIK
jgi:hypothetical protein